MNDSKQSKKNPQKYVKTTITETFDNALSIIEEKVGIPKADVVRAALHEYLSNHYSHFLPKSKNEILNEVKEKYYFEKYNQEFRDLEYQKSQIPVLESFVKDLRNRIDTNEKKLNTFKIKIQGKKHKSKHELEDWKRMKQNLEHDLERDKQQVKDSLRSIDNYKESARTGKVKSPYFSF